MRAHMEKDTLVVSFTRSLTASILETLEKDTQKQIFERGGFKGVTIDASNISEMDSLGINFIVKLYKELNSKGIEFKIIKTSRHIRQLFNLFKLTDYFKIT
ncbi:MAG: STAS domain-containing protein [Candidatus Cloacimonetes bacterium]|nr:STAS domain-containing protein [Candidatus Cloacimonadota bacterium]